MKINIACKEMLKGLIDSVKFIRERRFQAACIPLGGRVASFPAIVRPIDSRRLLDVPRTETSDTTSRMCRRSTDQGTYME